jgi:nucleoside-triphosphatase THEP1
MINVINGEIGSGKTTQLIDAYNATKLGDGYALVRVETKGVYVGQDIVRLSNKHFMPFCRIENHIPEFWNECEKYDKFSFSKEGMDFAKQIIWDIIKDKKPIAYIDEIGPLEFSGGGVNKEFALLVKTVKTIFVTIRNSLLPQFFSKYVIHSKTLKKS